MTASLVLATHGPMPKRSLFDDGHPIQCPGPSHRRKWPMLRRYDKTKVAQMLDKTPPTWNHRRLCGRGGMANEGSVAEWRWLALFPCCQMSVAAYEDTSMYFIEPSALQASKTLACAFMP